MILRNSLIAAVSLALVPALTKAADPTFTGTWHLKEDGSEARALPQRPPRVLYVEHSGNRIHFEDRDVTPPSRFTFTLDGKQNRVSSPAPTRDIMAKWEGNALLINSVVFAPAGQYTEMDRWRLSSDGMQLRIRRQIVGLRGEIESNLVYVRGDEKAGPAAVNSVPEKPVPADTASTEYVVERGTKIPLALINSVSSKHGEAGDRVYLQSVFPLLVNGRIVIPPGSYVSGTVTDVKRPGRLKGRAEIYVRFDSLILPNGTARDFRARIGNIDGRANEDIDRSEGIVKSEGNKSGDAIAIADAAGAGASVGIMAGSVAGRPAMGIGVGALAGTAAGLIGVLVSRGPEAELAAGSVVEMVLDRDLTYSTEELDRPVMPHGQIVIPGSGPSPSVKDRRRSGGYSRYPY